MERTARVLIAGEPEQCEAIAEVLGEAGLPCAAVARGQDALRAAADPGVGALLLDLALADRTGLEWFRRVRQLRPDLPIVVLAAPGDQERVLDALRLGAFDYLAKPLHEEELRLAVARALESQRTAAAWRRLQRRLHALGRTLESMWRRARGGEDGVRALQEATVEAAAEILDAARTSLLLVDESGRELRTVAARGPGSDGAARPATPAGEGIAGWVLARGEPVLVGDASGDPRFAGRLHPERYRSASFAVVPVAAGDRPFGVLCATERAGDLPLDAEDLSLLQILTAQVAQLLHAARGSARAPALEFPLAGPEPAEADAPEAELAHAVCDAIVEEVEAGRVLEAALDAVARRLRAEAVSLYLASDDGRSLALEARCEAGLRADRARLPRGRGIAAAVFESGQLVASEDPAEDPRFDAEVDTPEDGRALPLLCGPLRFRGRRLGVFRVFLEPGARPSARIGEVLSASLSAALRTALLYRSLLDSVDEVARARREGDVRTGERADERTGERTGERGAATGTRAAGEVAWSRR